MSDTVLTPMSKGAEVQRFEVFTGAGRRRRWPAEAKARIVAESHHAGETVSVVARRHGLTVQQLFGWRRQARQAALATAGGGAIGFVPVQVDHPVPAMIEVVIADALIRVPTGTDAATLIAVLRAVTGRA